MVPMKNSFGLEHINENIKSKLMTIGNIITLIFFVDLVLGFRRAFIDEKTGEHVKNPKLIAKQYLKFYFWIDLLGFIPFDMFTDNVYLRLFSLFKTIRLSRFHRLIQYMSFSTATKAKIRITLLIFITLIIMHWSACVFYVLIDQNFKEIVS